MYKSKLEGKTNDEIYSLITGLARVSLTNLLEEISNYPEEQQEKMKYHLAWYIPGGRKFMNNKIVTQLREEILNGESSGGSDGPTDDEEILIDANRKLTSAKEKLVAGEDLTDDEKSILASDENNDGVITTTSLEDNAGEPLYSSDEKNSEIQVFE